jgi:hypothetical protein
MLPAFVRGSVLTLMELWVAGQLDFDDQNTTQPVSTTNLTKMLTICITQNARRIRVKYARVVKEHRRVSQAVSHLIMDGAQINRSSMPTTLPSSDG